MVVAGRTSLNTPLNHISFSSYTIEVDIGGCCGAGLIAILALIEGGEKVRREGEGEGAGVVESIVSGMLSKGVLLV